jgi:3-hydroxyisobutyrate dehydrogenase-like beta-hydroxyacid dehydrogenase
VPLTLTAAAKEALDQACAAGLGDADFASVARLLRPAGPVRCSSVQEEG